jgi:phosphoenolpyruvate synthase/pyruvate phosphate dikinase
VEWAIARGLPFPDSVYILQHRPETTWAPGQPDAAPEEPDPAPPAAPEPDPKAPDPKARAYDPVAYALRNVFRVPGA